MEARLARLESDVDHIKSDIAELKTDVKDLRKELRDLRQDIHSTKLWALLLYIAQAAALLGTMAKGFKWI